MPSSPVFCERMELRRAQLSGASQGGYARTTGNLLREDSLEGAANALDRWRRQNAREWGHRGGWSEERCIERGSYTPPERSLDSQERVLRALRRDAKYFGLGASPGPGPLFDYIKGGQLKLGVPAAADPPAPSGPLASALNARLHRASCGVPTATRDRIFNRGRPQSERPFET